MAISISEDIIYNSLLNLTLDVYQNDGSNNNKALIVMHGGGWFQGDKKKDKDLALLLAGEGYIVFVPNYRLAPGNLYPAALNDAYSAYQWIKESGYSFDRNKIGIIGSSAGGNLAIEVAIKYGIPAVSWSGIIDMYEWVTQHENVIAQKDTTQNFASAQSSKIDQDGKNDPFYKWFILNYVGNDLNLLKEATLLYRLSNSIGPMFLANSLNEFVPISGVLALQSELIKYNIPSSVQFIAGRKHAKGYMDQVLDSSLAFFKCYL